MAQSAQTSAERTPWERLARDFLVNCRARNLSVKTIDQVYRPRLEKADRRDYLLIHGKAGARVSTRDRLVPIPATLARRLRRHARSRPHDARTNKLFLGMRRDPWSGEYQPLTVSGIELRLVSPSVVR